MRVDGMEFRTRICRRRGVVCCLLIDCSEAEEDKLRHGVSAFGNRKSLRCCWRYPINTW
ncbi:hypothetical protein RB213_010879 [Colletotrichum asianum]